MLLQASYSSPFKEFDHGELYHWTNLGHRGFVMSARETSPTLKTIISLR